VKRIVRSAVAAVVCALAAAALQATPALAQRVFVAAQGADTNPCSFALPCRSFQRAHDIVAAGGEIDVLDPAGYGALNIVKAISIQGHGFAGISVSSGIGIMVSANPSDAVNLNGVLIDGAGVGGFGIVFNGGKSLTLTNCVVRNLVNDALQLRSTASTPMTLTVADSYIGDNGGSGVAVLTQSTGPVNASIERSVFQRNTVSVNVDGSNGTGALNVAVTDSVAANSPSGIGFEAFSATSHSATGLMLTRVTAAGNQSGVIASGSNATVWLAHSNVTANANGYVVSGSANILSYGDNYIDGNTTNTGSLGSATKQ
jgi:hypothetical protein